MDTVESLCNHLVRSKLLQPDAVRTLRQRWLDENKSVGDPAHFGQWLIANGVLTDFQLGVLQRGFAELLFLDAYKLLERIGQGRMAGVYKAVHKLGQVVAIKVLPLSRGKDPELLARFQREARMALQLQHPHCVRTFQVGTTAGGLHYIVMEYLDGTTLNDVLERRGKLPAKEALHVLSQSLQGLAHIEAQGMVHRDLKPANLMLVQLPTSKAKGIAESQVKILDIGLGRVLFDENASDDELSQLTSDNVVLGTPLYMAPEQARSSRTADIRADIYSLGCVLYHMLTAQPPFPDSSVVQQVVRHAKEMPRPLSTFTADVMPGLQDVVDKMLAKSPEQRFASPTAALKMLHQRGLVQSTAQTAEINAPMPSFLKWLKRHGTSQSK